MAQRFLEELSQLPPEERHRRLIERYRQKKATDLDALHAGHRFLRSEEDDEDDSVEARVAKKYYKKLFKEYAIADLSYCHQGKLGLRWRTKEEVKSGKGQFVCGAKGCEANEGLASYEVNFAYEEAKEQKQALVKVRVCPPCSEKLRQARGDVSLSRRGKRKRRRSRSNSRKERAKQRDDDERKSESGSEGQEAINELLE